MVSEENRSSLEDFEDPGLYQFAQEFGSQYDEEAARNVLDFVGEHYEVIEGTSDEVKEWMKSMSPRVETERLFVDDYEIGNLNYIATLRDVHDLSEPNHDLQTDQLVFVEGVEEPESSAYTLGYGVIDCIVSNQAITKRTVGEEVQTTARDILDRVDELNQGSVSVNAPNFLSHYIESQYGKGFRKVGEALEQEFGSAPKKSPHPASVGLHDIGRYTSKINGVMVTLNDAYTEQNDVDVMPPSWFVNR